MARNPSKIFVDSGGFIALVYKSDLQHRKATQFYERVKQKAVFYTTNIFGDVHLVTVSCFARRCG